MVLDSDGEEVVVVVVAAVVIYPLKCFRNMLSETTTFDVNMLTKITKKNLELGRYKGSGMGFDFRGQHKLEILKVSNLMCSSLNDEFLLKALLVQEI